MRKNSLKQFIFKRLENGERITDADVAKFLGKEPDFYTVEIYKQEFYRLENTKQFFKDYEQHPDTKIKKSYRGYYLENETLIGSGKAYKIPKIYYQYLYEKQRPT